MDKAYQISERICNTALGQVRNTVGYSETDHPVAYMDGVDMMKMKIMPIIEEEIKSLLLAETYKTKELDEIKQALNTVKKFIQS